MADGQSTNGTDNGDRTRDRLLKAATEVFSEVGFRKATVREIVSRAEANLNAINYHFGDKEAPYQAVFEYAHQHLEADEHMKDAMNIAFPTEQRLRALIRAFLNQAVHTNCRPCMSRLMLMELAEPTGAMDAIVEKFMKPRFNYLVELIRAFVNDDMPEEKICLCAESIVGQCVHLVHSKEITTRIMPFLTYSPESIEQLVDHVVEFSLAAMNNLNTSRTIRHDGESV